MTNRCSRFGELWFSRSPRSTLVQRWCRSGAIRRRALELSFQYLLLFYSAGGGEAPFKTCIPQNVPIFRASRRHQPPAAASRRQQRQRIRVPRFPQHVPEFPKMFLYFPKCSYIPPKCSYILHSKVRHCMHNMQMFLYFQKMFLYFPKCSYIPPNVPIFPQRVPIFYIQKHKCSYIPRKCS